MIEIILFLIIFIAVIIKFNKQVKWLLTPFAWFKDIIDPQWWANFIGNKTGLFQRASNNPYKRWLETLPPRKKLSLIHI